MNRSWKGAIFKMLSSVLFSLNNVWVASFQHTFPQVPYSWIMTLQYLGGALLLLPWVNKNSILPQGTSRFWILLRLFFSWVGLNLFYVSLGNTPLIQVMCMSFFGPLVMTTGAKYWLYEHISFRRWMALMLSMAASFLIVMFPYEVKATAWSLPPIKVILYPLGASLCFSLSTLLTKRLAWEKSPLDNTWMMMMGMGVLCLLQTCVQDFFNESVVILSWKCTWALGQLMGLCILAHVCLITAFSWAEISFLQPFGSLRLIATALLAWKNLQQPISLIQGAGMMLIISSLFLLGYDLNLNRVGKKNKIKRIL
jgi:drug/metabolite transporter (DMT)-like permease